MQKINLLLQKLTLLQQGNPTGEQTGVFNSVRKHDYFDYARNDNNLFFTSAILALFQLHKDKFNNALSASLIDDMTQKAQEKFHLYVNKAGGITYNFWQEHPKNAFPNSKLIFNHKHFHIPDDLDDTAMAFLAIPHKNSLLYGLKQRAYVHINGHRKTVKNTFKELVGFETYTTWSGNAMYYEFDVCVLCNLLTCFYHYNMPKDYFDEQAEALIETVLANDWHIQYPYETSHHYANTTLILYHLGKLCQVNTTFAERWKKKLKQDISNRLIIEKKDMGRVMLLSTLLKLGYKVAESIEVNDLSYPYFIIGIFTPYEDSILRKFAQKSWSWLYYECEAYSLALLVEYHALKNQTLLS